MNSSEIIFEEAFNKLNSEQANAVKTTEGPVLLLAGPGTGKTEVLAIRIGQILRESDVYPSNILCLTFSNAAVDAMRSRLCSLIGEHTAKQIPIHTFHGFSNQLIQEDNSSSAASRKLISEAQKRMLLEQLIFEHYSSSDSKQLKPPAESKINSLLRIFSVFKQEGISKQIVLDYANYCINNIIPFEEKCLTKKGEINAYGKKIKNDIEHFTQNISELYDKYQNQLKIRNLMEYDDMLTDALDILKSDSDLRAAQHEKYQYILVDEFQDTNQKQIELLDMLISDLVDEPNIFIVGDDDQCVYRFQGAFNRNFDWVRNRFGTGLKTILLNINYRSTQKILDESFSLIKQNQSRQPEKAHALKMGHSRFIGHMHHDPVFLQYQDADQEAYAIAIDVRNKIKAGIQPSEISVLARKWTDLIGIKKWFDVFSISWQHNQNWTNFLEVYPGIGIFNLIQFLAKYTEQKEYSNAYLVQYLLYKMPNHAFIKNILECQKSKSSDYYQYLKENNNDIELRDKISFYIIDDLLSMINDPINEYTLELLELAVYSGMERTTIERCTVWREFVADFLKTDKLKTLKSLADTLWYYQQSNIPIKFQIEGYDMDKNSIVLSTIHGSKGLEFEAVYVIGCNSNNWENPSKNGKINVPDLLNRYITPEPESIDDFRKLLYVGMTRAKSYLHLSCHLFSEAGRPKNVTKLLEQFGFLGGYQLKEVAYLTYEEISSENPVLKFHPDLLPLINEKLSQFEISPTSTGTWIDCQSKFLLTQVLKIGTNYSEAPTFGTIVHDVLHSYASARKEDRNPVLIMRLISDQMERRKSLFHSTHYNKYLEYAKWLIPNYLNKFPINQNDYLLENTLRMELDASVKIKGKLDRIEVMQDQVRIVDYKTGRSEQPKKPFESSLNPGSPYWRQAVMYRMLVNANYRNNKNVHFEFHYPEKDNTIVFCEDNPTESFLQWIGQIWQQTKQLRFAKCSNQTCIYCETVRRMSSQGGSFAE